MGEQHMKNLGLLVLRLTVGTLLAGHGAQKLFGWFEGPGWRNTAGWAESINLRPGEVWGTMAGVSEFAGGTLTALGLLEPIGPVAAISAMSMATAKVHWGKPIWANKGGAEMAVTNMAAATAILLAGHGTLSLDEVLGTRLPRWIAVPGLAFAAGAVYAGVTGELPLPKAWQVRLKQQLALWQRQARGRLESTRTALEGSIPSATPSAATTSPAPFTARGASRASAMRSAATSAAAVDSSTRELQESDRSSDGDTP
jgi:putative oxidoreductase